MKNKYLTICFLITIFQFPGFLIREASAIESIEPLIQVANSLVSHSVGERHARDYVTGIDSHRVGDRHNRDYGTGFTGMSNGLAPNTFNMDAYNTVMNDNSGVWYLSDEYKEYKDIQGKRDKVALFTGIATVLFKGGSALCGHIKDTREAEAHYLKEKADWIERKEYLEWYI